MLPAEAPRAYNFVIPSKMVLWQHVGDLRPLGGITKEMWLAVRHNSSESRVRVPVLAGYFSLVIPPSGQRSPTCSHNIILDETAKLYARGASAGSMSFTV